MMQSYMTQAYDRWRNHEDWKQEDFWDSLDRKERFAVFLGNMNYQVENGGWSQWAFNGYMTEETVGYILRVTKRMNTESSLKVHDMVEEYWNACNQDRKSRRNYWNDEKDDESFVDDDKLCTQYYAINDQFMKDCENYLILGF